MPSPRRATAHCEHLKGARQSHWLHEITSALSLLAMTEKGRAFSGGEGSYSRLAGAGFSLDGCMGKEAVTQRSRVHPRVKLDIGRKQGCLSTLLSFLAAKSNDLSKIIDSRKVGAFHKAVISEVDPGLAIQGTELI